MTKHSGCPSVTLDRGQHILAVHILQLQLNPEVRGIRKQGSGSISRHHHSAQTRDDKLLERRKVLNDARRPVQEIHGLKEVDLLRGL
jgi:hypothetical protein